MRQCPWVSPVSTFGKPLSGSQLSDATPPSAQAASATWRAETGGLRKIRAPRRHGRQDWSEPRVFSTGLSTKKQQQEPSGSLESRCGTRRSCLPRVGEDARSSMGTYVSIRASVWACPPPPLSGTVRLLYKSVCRTTQDRVPGPWLVDGAG
ncbi:hypothetical protein LIA77_02751 [Sarocladium implicatum]|nr:hypothetical protein LIA77_02751 [Sarocladium implicatum]